MMKNCKEMCCGFCGKWRNPGFGLFVLRVVLGVIFVAHGWQKTGMMEQWVGFVTSGAEVGGLGLPMFVAYLVPAVEILAGLAMILGVATCVAGILLAGQMAAVIFLVKWGGTLIPGASGKPAYELDLILLVSALVIVLSGPGKYGIRSLIKGKCQDVDCSNCKVA